MKLTPAQIDLLKHFARYPTELLKGPNGCGTGGGVYKRNWEASAKALARHGLATFLSGITRHGRCRAGITPAGLEYLKCLVDISGEVL